jgi:peptidoglycan/xylan/chitin deacetylase (PgdA/CDA1 family)
MKRFLLPALLFPGVARSLSAVLHRHAVIFMMHRIRQPDLGVDGHELEELRRLLAHLRKHRYELVSLDDVFARLRGQGPRAAGCVAITLDDGYADQAELAGPVFAEFDCPATVFVTTGFLDGEVWFWWDRIDHILRRSERRSISLELEGEALKLEWSDDSSRDGSRDAFVARCKRLFADERDAAIDRLATAAEVELPPRPPRAYAPMSWDTLRSWERRGMSFGAHTVTHPILSQTDDAQSKHELSQSWARLRTEAARPSPIFCYPNGQWEDFGDREIATLRALGMQGAVVGAPGYASLRRAVRPEEAPFEVLRFNLPHSVVDLVQVVSGFERLKEMLRRESA